MGLVVVIDVVIGVFVCLVGAVDVGVVVCFVGVIDVGVVVVVVLDGVVVVRLVCVGKGFRVDGPENDKQDSINPGIPKVFL